MKTNLVKPADYRAARKWFDDYIDDPESEHLIPHLAKLIADTRLKERSYMPEPEPLGGLFEKQPESRPLESLASIEARSSLPHTLARSGGPETSKAAAIDIAKNAQPLMHKVMAYAHQVDDFTQWELQEHFNNHGSTYRSRVRPLVDAGYLRETEARRANGNGRPATVFTRHGAKPWPHEIQPA